MAQDSGMTARTSNPNNEPRLQAGKDVARTQGISYKRDNSSKTEKRSDSRQRR